MFKKLLMAVAIVTIGATSSYGIALGLEGGATTYGGGAALSLGFGDISAPDATAALSFRFGNSFVGDDDFDSSFHIAGHYKWHFWNYKALDWLRLSFAIGPEVGFGHYSWKIDGTKYSFSEISVGARFAFTASAIIIQQLEIFLGLNATPGVSLRLGDDKSYSKDHKDSAGFYIPVGLNLGIRWWF